MVPLGGLGGELRTPNGEPIVGARVFVPDVYNVGLWGVTNASGRFQLTGSFQFKDSSGVADPPNPSRIHRLMLFAKTAKCAGGFAPIDWQQIVKGTWRGVVEPQEITVRFVDAESGGAIAGSSIRLVPHYWRTSFLYFTTPPTSTQPELGQAQFQIIRGSSWMAFVQTPDSQDEGNYPLEVDADGVAIIRVQKAPRIRVRARDYLGAPVSGARMSLGSNGGSSKPCTTDDEGRVQFPAGAGVSYDIWMADSLWQVIKPSPSFLQVQADEYEVTLARTCALNLSLEAVGFEPPDKAHLVFFGPSSPEFLSVRSWRKSTPSRLAHDGITRIVVLAPGCLHAEAHFDAKDANGNLNAVAHVVRGPTVTVPRSELPSEFAMPLKGIAQALRIAESLIKNYSITDDFHSEGVASDAGMVFGPLTPGTYELRIFDAQGKVLWKETRVIR
jgi:hypothetical protein